MRLPAVTCRRLFIFGPCERGKYVEEENFSLGRLRGEITKTLPELVPRLGKQQSLSCSVPYQASVALFPPFPSPLILLFEVESNLADENDNWRVTSATTK